MIVDFFNSIGASFSIWIAGLFPAWDPPAWMTETPGKMHAILQDYQGLGVWIDWIALGICVSVVVGTFVVGSAIRLTRAVVAHIPMVGGGG